MPVNAKQVRIKATAFRCYIDFLRIIRSLRLLLVLHDSDLGRRDTELDETGLDPTIGGEAARRFDIERAEVGKYHL